MAAELRTLICTESSLVTSSVLIEAPSDALGILKRNPLTMKALNPSVHGAFLDLCCLTSPVTDILPSLLQLTMRLVQVQLSMEAAIILMNSTKY